MCLASESIVLVRTHSTLSPRDCPFLALDVWMWLNLLRDHHPSCCRLQTGAWGRKERHVFEPEPCYQALGSSSWAWGPQKTKMLSRRQSGFRRKKEKVCTAPRPPRQHGHAGLAGASLGFQASKDLETNGVASPFTKVPSKKTRTTKSGTPQQEWFLVVSL